LLDALGKGMAVNLKLMEQFVAEQGDDVVGDCVELEEVELDQSDKGVDIERVGETEQNKKPPFLKRVSTQMITQEIDALDKELGTLIQGQIKCEKEAEENKFERQMTLMHVKEKGANQTALVARQKAKQEYYIFFLIVFLVTFAVGMYVITIIEDYDWHWLVYASIFYFLATLSVALDLFDMLLPFISFWENCWNVPKLLIRVNVEWPSGDSKQDRRDRKSARQKIVKLTKEFMNWDQCCSALRYRFHIKIHDQSLLIGALVRNKKDQAAAMANGEALEEKLKSSKFEKCKIQNLIIEDIKFERCAPHYSMILFFIIAISSYILLKITDEEDGYQVPDAVTTISDVVFYIAILLSVIALLANWTKFSFFCSERAYVQGLLNISIIGFFILSIARILRPPLKTEKNKIQDITAITWHKYHDWSQQVEGVVFMVVVLWIMFVFFFVISVAAFAEFANEAANWGVGPALSCFIAFAMVIMLAPPAPGNIIDVFGGFLIVIVLVRDNSEVWSFFSATAVAFVMVVALHYTGACFQWMIGKLPFAQQWMNRALPIEMLATSDAVLGDANWFKVGLVGFVFLDTANGLNQGRIEMEFWTQLLSEWGAFPNGLSLVSFGATLALSGLSCDEDTTTGCLTGNFAWTAQAIPLLFIMSGLIQILGTTRGVGALAGSLDTDKYVMAREKWYIVHRMMGIGYIPTRKGWKEDVYELAKTDKPNRTPYFEKACNLQHDWLKTRKKCRSAVEVTEAVECFKHEKWIPLRYQDHMKYLLRKTMSMEMNNQELFKELFRKKEKTDLLTKGMWDDVQTNKLKKMIQSFIVAILIVCFYLGMLGFYMALDLEDAVKEGLDFLWKIEYYYWISAGVFVFFSCVFYFDPLKKYTLNFFSGIIYFMRCCPVDEAIETGFLTPVWPVPAE